jgi:hypothetical protein
MGRHIRRMLSGVIAGVLVIAIAPTTSWALGEPDPQGDDAMGILSLVADQPVSAGKEGNAETMACRFGARNYPYQYISSSGTRYIRSSAWTSGCSSYWKFSFQLQRSRWYGWEPMKESNWTGSRSKFTLSYRCKYYGTHDWRTLGRWYDGWSYERGSGVSSTRRFTCVP